jgi:hypothetical protein
MIYLEAALLTICLSLCAVASITDIRHGLIANKHILCAAIPATALNAVYYFSFARTFFPAFVVNLSIMILISILFYAYHLWSAGDSKLLIMVIFCIPARICYKNSQTLAPTIQVIILIFSLAYVYLIVQSIVLGIKKRDLFEIKTIRLHIRNFLRQYLQCTVYAFLLNELLYLPIFINFYSYNIDLIMIINLLFMLTILHVRFFSNKNVMILATIATLVLAYLTGFEILGSLQPQIYILAVVIVLLRMIAEKYNYQTIPTTAISQGMVLAWTTILLFKPSRIHGLPVNTTEDIRSKLTHQEVGSIIRWRSSKYGKEEIVIVSKMPFAIFIALGTIIFIIMRFWLYDDQG